MTMATVSIPTNLPNYPRTHHTAARMKIALTLATNKNHKAQRSFRKQRIGKARKRQRPFCRVRRCGVKTRFGKQTKNDSIR
ncbi:hypothetical protein YC2023_009531 [Brassica napus]